MGKGSGPRPFSVSQVEFGNNFDRIFGKRDRMTPHYKDNGEDVGTCGCGRSPTGKCIGWHGLTEEMYQHQKMLWLEDQFRKDAEDSDGGQID